TLVVFLNVLATIALWRSAASRPEKPDRKLRNRLWKSKPITPKHQPPPPLKKGLFVADSTLQFFSDFEDFANVVNAWLTQSHAHPYHSSPWRHRAAYLRPNLCGVSQPGTPRQARNRTCWVIILRHQNRAGPHRTRLGPPPGLRDGPKFPCRHCYPCQ